MARTKRMDNLSKDMIQCKKDGYGVHYGKWKAMQKPVTMKKKIPDGWLVCENCGVPFKPNRTDQRFCDSYCQRQAYAERVRKQQAEGDA